MNNLEERQRSKNSLCQPFNPPLSELISFKQNLREVIPQWQRVRHVICKVTTIAYGDPLGGAYTTAKNNGAAPERWNYSHNLVPFVLCFHRDTQSNHESFTNIATPPLCFTVALTKLMSNTGCGLCKHWKPGICNGVSSRNKCVSISATTSKSSNNELIFRFVFVPPWMFHRETRNALWSQHP